MGCLYCKKKTDKIWGRSKKYCDVSCRDKYFYSLKKKTFSEIKCIVCDTVFMPVSKTNKCCSWQCKRKNDTAKRSNKPKIKKCSFCEKEYTPYTSLDKFCSANCRTEKVKSKRIRRWSKDSVAKRMGKKNPAYVHGQAVKGSKQNSEGLRLFRKNREEYEQEMIDRVGYLYCERCGKSNVRLETHHVIWRSEKPGHPNLHDKINMTKACVPCHNHYHNHKGSRNEMVKERGLDKIFGNDVLDK
jgi:hypothetical protein